jgi:hypothetical protein
MSAKNWAAMALAFVAGILLIMTGISGLASWEMIRNFVTAYVIDNIIVQYVFAVLILLASLGGFTVIAGAVFLGKNSVRTGKFLIGVGTGMGLIGLLISIGMAVANGTFALDGFLTAGTIGIILSIAARSLAKGE